MADKVSRRLSYDPTPNMAGLFADNIPSAPALVPSFVEQDNSPTPPPPVPPHSPRSFANAEPAPAARRTAPIAASPAASSAASGHEDQLEEDYRPERVTRAKPRATKAPAAARPAAPRRTTARAQPVVSSEARVRRTLRIPKSFDKKLRELASLLGVNLNSAILAAVEAEWQRRIVERRRA